uniref:Uncharacterized protein n=1 Tax=Arcella intermedia TaxID=1963864 RepID=A0A6B2LF36_9EUKA
MKEWRVEVGGTTLRLAEEKPYADRDNKDVPVDTLLFDPTYTVAAATGLNVWEGAWIFVDYLKGPFGQAVSGKRVVELGAGTGISGLCTAAAGGHVLMTDVASIASSILQFNLDRNTSTGEGKEGNGEGWHGSVPVGAQGGSAAVMALDWTASLESQSILNNPLETDFVIATDTVWLANLVDHFVGTVRKILGGPRQPVCLLAFQDRYDAGTDVFAALQTLTRKFNELQCTVQEVPLSLPQPPTLYHPDKKHILQITLNK